MFQLWLALAGLATFIIGLILGARICGGTSRLSGFLGRLSGREASPPDETLAELARSEERYRVLIDHSPDAIVVYDTATGRFIDVNEQAMALFEASREQLLERGPQDLSPPYQPDGRSSKEAAQDVIGKAIAGSSQAFDWIHTTIDGKPVPCEVRLVHLPSREGTWIRASILDVSERDATERELAETTGRLKIAQRLAQMGSWEYDIVSETMLCSEELYRICELDSEADEFSYHRFLDLVHPDDKAWVDQAYKTALKSGEPYEEVHRLLMADGRVKWVYDRGETLYSDDGQPILARGTIQDITERKITEDALHESEAILSTFLSVAPEAVIVTDDQFRVIEFSHGAETIFGYSREEAIGQNVGMFRPENAREEQMRILASFAEDADAEVFDAPLQLPGLRKNGEEFPSDATLCRLQMPSATYFALLLRDVSAERRSRDALVQAKMDAEAASEAKSRFIANISHELRTPLNAIIGFSELLVGKGDMQFDSTTRMEYARDILDSGRHLLSIINDILELSRLDLGNIQLNDRRVDLREVLDQCSRMVSLKAAENEVRLRIDIADNVPDVYADQRLLLQAMLNLASNAVKFTGAGGTITLGARLAEDGGVDLFVADNGIGMSEASIARIGEPFMQADSSLSRRFEGTGLGLTIVKRLAELHDARLIVESELGHGTTATITLPQTRIHAPLMARQS